MALTKLTDMINPEVMADMISAKLPKKIVVTPFAKVDTTLQGVAGDTITIPAFKYIGDAEDVAEGVAVDTTKLETTSDTATIKKAMKAVDITDEALLSGYGDPLGEINSQLAKSIASKVDEDAMTALLGASLTYDGSAGVISYAGVVNAIDVFNEELNSEKVMFVNPHQVSQLRLDPDFISKDKYSGDVIMSGEIGKIANTRIVPSKRVVLDTKTNKYTCPIVKLTNDSETEDDTAALTIFLKRGVNVESERNTLKRTTAISVDEFYVVALTDESKVVLATFASEAGE